jgi:prophage DNA circulation protein
MSWVDGYLQASFRNVEFYVEKATGKGGRRIVNHVFPERDDEYHEDLGRKNKEYNISAYLIGDEYFNHRQDLIDALDKGGPGRLIHPYLGDIDVICDNWTSNETNIEGRMVRFDIIFKWETDVALTILGPSAAVNLLDKKQNFIEKLIDALEAAYDIATQPIAVIQDVVNMIDEVYQIVEVAKKVTGSIDEFKAMLDTVRGRILTAIFDVRVIANDIKNIIDFGTDPTDAILGDFASDDLGKDQYSSMKTVTEYDQIVVTQYPTIVAEEKNYPVDLLQKYVARIALASKAGLVQSMTIENSMRANEINIEIDKLIRRIEEDEEITDDVYESSRDLRVAVDKVIDERKLSLKEITTINLSEFEPAINIAYDLYGDPSRDLEIAKQNEILHPGFMPGFVDLIVKTE